MNGRVLLVLISIAAVQFGLIRASAEEFGIASVYTTESGGGSHTANGERLKPNAFTAAHRTLPLGTNVLVTNKKNGRSVTVTITDRGPFVRGRIIDVTPAAARELGFSGLTQVSIQALNERPVIRAVPISHYDEPVLPLSEPKPDGPDGFAKPADAEPAADAATASESAMPGASAKKARTRSSYVQRRDRSAYSLSPNYMQYHYQVGYARAWWPGLGRQMSGKYGRQTWRATWWPF
jgi:rare lipoprotein A